MLRSASTIRTLNMSEEPLTTTSHTSIDTHTIKYESTTRHAQTPVELKHISEKQWNPNETNPHKMKTIFPGKRLRFA